MAAIFFQAGLLLCLCGLSFSADFTSGPSVTDEGARWVIRFSVSEYTDVAVYVEDTATGKIVAHIAAGNLGPKAPAPFQQNSLSQTVYWDKLDDAGNALSAACDIRVGLGLRARMDRFYGWQGKYVMNYAEIGSIVGMVVDSQGNLIVQGIDGHSNQRYTRLWMFDRNGNYVRTLMPYSGQLPEDRVRGFGRINMPGGKTIPVQYAFFAYSVIPEFPTGNSNGLSISPQGWLVVPNGSQVHCGYNSKVPRVLILGLDGSCPRDTVFGPRYPRPKVPGGISYYADSVYHQGIHPTIATAVTADGQSLYLGVDTAVFKSALDYTGVMAPFAMLQTTSGVVSKVNGLAVDASGRVYVSDWPKDRVLVYDSTGALKDSIKITRPFELKVHPTTGQVYVASADSALNRFVLKKYSPYPALDSMAASAWITGDAFIFRSTNSPKLALDYAANPPRVWVGSLAWNYARLICFQDDGTSFSRLPTTIGGPDGVNADQMRSNGQGFLPPFFIAVDPDEKVCYTGTCVYSRIDLQTGAVTKSNIHASELIFSNDGQSLYGWGIGYNYALADSFVRRYDPRTEARIKWPNGSDSLLVHSTYFYNYGASRGISLDPRGNLYVAANDVQGTGHLLSLYRFSPDGTRLDTPVFTLNDAYNGPNEYGGRNAAAGFAVDRQGSLYTATNIRPRSLQYPDEFIGQPFFPDIATTHESWNYSAYNQYAFTLGSVFKFQPSGGSIMREAYSTLSTVPVADLSGDTVPVRQVDGFYRDPFRVTGAVWQNFGFSYLSGIGGGGDDMCACHMPHVTMDRFGRLFVPDAARFGVTVLDNNGGEIVRIGEYGNADDMGGGEVIPLAHPNYFAVVNKNLYISDIVNNRIVKVNLGYRMLWSQYHGIDTSFASARNLPSLADGGRITMCAFPQPFSPGVHLAFNLPGAERVTLSIYSVDGRLIKRLAKGLMPQGRHTVVWTGMDEKGKSLANGLYVVRLLAESGVLTKSLMRVR